MGTGMGRDLDRPDRKGPKQPIYRPAARLGISERSGSKRQCGTCGISCRVRRRRAPWTSRPPSGSARRWSAVRFEQAPAAHLCDTRAQCGRQTRFSGGTPVSGESTIPRRAEPMFRSMLGEAGKSARTMSMGIGMALLLAGTLSARERSERDRGQSPVGQTNSAAIMRAQAGEHAEDRRRSPGHPLRPDLSRR